VQKYEEVVKKWPHGAYTAAAKQRIGDLKNRETRQMYDDLAKFTPPGAVEPGGTLTKPPALDLPSERPKSLDEPKKTAPASK